MFKIKKKYVVDEKKRPFAVQVDIATFERMERLIEDYPLGQLINENNPNDNHLIICSPITYNFV